MPHSSYAPTQSSTSSQMPSASASAARHHRTRQARRAGFRHGRNRLLGCQNIRTRRWRQGRCRCRTHPVRPHSSSSSQIPSASTSAKHVPPHTPKASAGCRHNHFSFRDVRTSALVDSAWSVTMPHSSSSPTQSSTSSQMPSSPHPPHTPHIHQ